MDPVTLVVVPGLLGGLVLAFLIVRLSGRRQTGSHPRIVRTEPLSTDVINMARIRVAGVGGLGLVAMATVVALFVPRIRQSVALSLVLGAIFAAILIVRRRRVESRHSSGPTAGAHTIFALDAPPRQEDEPEAADPDVRADLMPLPSARTV